MSNISTDNIKVYANCRIADDTTIGEFSVIGRPGRPSYQTGHLRDEGVDGHAETIITRIQSGCHIGAHVLIEEGAKIDSDCVIESKCVVESGVLIGARSFLVQGARVCKDSRISEACVIGGLIAERSVVGSGSRIFGALIHTQENPDLPWDGNVEAAPTIAENVFIGMGALVVGPVNISSQVYICAGATVTRNVPSMHVVKGVNEMIPVEQWKGKLSESTWWQLRL